MEKSEKKRKDGKERKDEKSEKMGKSEKMEKFAVGGNQIGEEIREKRGTQLKHGEKFRT